MLKSNVSFTKVIHNPFVHLVWLYIFALLLYLLIDNTIECFLLALFTHLKLKNYQCPSLLDILIRAWFGPSQLPPPPAPPPPPQLRYGDLGCICSHKTGIIHGFKVKVFKTYLPKVKLVIHIQVKI